MNAAEFDALCRMARLALDEKEKEKLRGQMSQIRAYVEQLGEVDVKGVEPLTGEPLPAEKARPDEPGTCLSPDEALANAPKRQWNFFQVPQVMED